MSLVSPIESAQATISAAALLLLEQLYSVQADIYRPTISAEEEVYGVSGSGDDQTTILGVANIILTQSAFSAAGPQVFGFSEGQVIYTRYSGLQPSDMLVVERSDDKPLRFRVISAQGLGLTQIVMYQLTVSSIVLA